MVNAGRLMGWIAVCAVVSGPWAHTSAAEGPVTSLIPVQPSTAIHLELQGIGELRFGERLEWRLVSEPPTELRAGEGIRVGPVWIRSMTGAISHELPEPAGFSRAETGNRCSVSRVDVYAVIRCSRDYVFNTRTGAAPVQIAPQFKDRSDAAAPWLKDLPLPWWRFADGIVSGKPLVFLAYGYVNYGQAVETTDLYRGPALLDLESGRIAVARTMDGVESAVYDASTADETEAVALFPQSVVADEIRQGRRSVIVMTVFDRCVAARCRGDSDPGFRSVLPLVFEFE